MSKITPVILTVGAIIGCAAATASGQALSPSDMQQKLDQEMANARRAASESSSSTRRNANDVTTDAERKMDDLATQHKSQAERTLAEEIEKSKKKPQGMQR